MVAGSIFANASSTGANTVNSSPFRVSTRFTSGFSWPETAAVSVVSSGLFDAAVATGSVDMPSTEPAPSGTCSAYAAHPAPTRSAAGSISSMASSLGVASSDMAGASLSAAAPPELQPTSPSDAAAKIEKTARAVRVLRDVDRIGVLLRGCQPR